MTPREWARLQGFPDSFRLPLADTHSYKQLGNSVTVTVIEAIAKQIRVVLDGKCQPASSETKKWENTAATEANGQSCTY